MTRSSTTRCALRRRRARGRPPVIRDYPAHAMVRGQRAAPRDDMVRQVMDGSQRNGGPEGEDSW